MTEKDTTGDPSTMQGKWKFTARVSKEGSEKWYCFTWKLKWDGEQSEIMQIGCHRWCEHQIQSNGPNSILTAWWGRQQGTAIRVQEQRNDRWEGVWVRWIGENEGRRLYTLRQAWEKDFEQMLICVAIFFMKSLKWKQSTFFLTMRYRTDVVCMRI